MGMGATISKDIPENCVLFLCSVLVISRFLKSTVDKLMLSEIRRKTINGSSSSHDLQSSPVFPSDTKRNVSHALY